MYLSLAIVMNENGGKLGLRKRVRPAPATANQVRNTPELPIEVQRKIAKFQRDADEGGGEISERTHLEMTCHDAIAATAGEDLVGLTRQMLAPAALIV
jgi:hypothetical protein